MRDILDFMIESEYFTTGLIILLIVLIILFFIVLFLGKEKNVKNELAKDELKNDENNQNNNIDFDHNEYVKETTAEFELAPVSEVAPAPDNFVPEATEETPAIKFNSKEEPVLKDFSFDELSKSISEELDKLKLEEEQAELSKEFKPVVINNIADLDDAFKESSEEIPVETPKAEEVKDNSENISPVFITDAVSTKEEEMVLPKLANEEVKEVQKEETPKPVLSDDEVPLFARFNQETYDINKKD